MPELSETTVCPSCGGGGLVYDQNPSRKAYNHKITCGKCSGSGYLSYHVAKKEKGPLAQESERLGKALRQKAIDLGTEA